MKFSNYYLHVYITRERIHNPLTLYKIWHNFLTFRLTNYPSQKKNYQRGKYTVDNKLNIFPFQLFIYIFDPKFSL